jgi:hypothetical protein
MSVDASKIYSLQNNKQGIIEEQLNLFEQNAYDQEQIQQTFQDYFTDEKDYDLLKVVLLQKLQKFPDQQFYSDLLIWTFIQQQNFEAAFMQSLAMDKRLSENGQRLYSLGVYCKNNKQYEVASKASLPVNESFSTVTATLGTLPTGFTHTGLTGYLNSALKFDTQGDWLQLYFTGTPGVLSFDLGVNNNFTSTVPSGVTFTLLESSDGTSFTTLATYSNVACGTKSISNLNTTTRYLKWVYTLKPTGSNISLKNLTLASGVVSPSLSGAAITTTFTTTFGTASTAQQFPVSGSNLTNDIIATAPTGFEVSIDGQTYGTTATFVQSGGVASGTLYIRLSNSAAVGTTNYNSQNIELSSTGATSIYITTPTSGNAVNSASLQNQTITFGALASVTYGDSSFTVSATSSASLTNFTFSSSNQNVATISGNTVTIVGAGATTITASEAGNSTYNPGSAQQVLVVNTKALTILNAQAQNKAYDGNNTAVITGGTLDGIISPDVVTLTQSGTFASVDVANGILVTSTSTISGANAANYSLTQPTGLLANITIAPQSITFSALAPKVVGEALTLNAFSATSSANPITYSSSNLSVATISGNEVTILAEGTTVISAAQVGSANYAAAEVFQTLNVNDAIAKWTFETIDFPTSASSVATPNAGLTLADLGSLYSGSEVSGVHASASSVWSTPTGNASANSLNSNNWAPGDYYQFKVATQNYYNISVTYDQAGSSTGPRDFKFQYSTDGTNFIDFGSEYIVNVNATTNPNAWSSSTYYSLFNNVHDLSTITDLNNKSFVYFRIVNTTTTAINASPTAASGTGRIDNFTVKGLLCPTITPSFSIAPPASICISATATYTTEPNQTNYIWTIPGVSGTDYTIVSGGVGASNSVTIQWLTTGSKAVSVSYTNSNGCNSATTATTSNIINDPTFTATNPSAVCAPATVNLETTVNNSSLTYQYYTNSSATTVYSTPSTAGAGTYFIVGSDGTCSTSPQQVTVTVNPLPTVAAITGTTSFDLNTTSTLSSTTSGGVWTSSNDLVATVNPNGVVTGVSVGSATIAYTITSLGCSNSQSVLVSINALGAASLDLQSLSFYPNPIQDNLNINYKEEISSVEMYNMLGQKLFEAYPKHRFFTLNVSNFTPGNYFLKIKSGEFFTTIKVLKK